VDKAMATARVWSSRTTIVGRALRRLRQPRAGYRLLALCAQSDAVIKGRVRGDPWLALTTVVLALCGPPDGRRRAA
jgi:DNA polymerase III delta subunit